MAQILQDLDSEWSRLVASPTGRRSLIRWAATHDVLAGHGDLDGVLESRRDPARAGGVLLALATLAPHDEVAARTLLQALLPGIVRLGMETASDDTESIAEMVSLAWERIRTYPVRRQGSVAANVLLDVRKAYRRHRRIDAPDSPGITFDPLDEGCSTEDAVMGRLLVEQIADAQSDGLMSRPVMATILRTRLCGDRLADVAAEQDISQRLLCLHRWRAEVRLRTLPLAG